MNATELNLDFLNDLETEGYTRPLGLGIHAVKLISLRNVSNQTNPKGYWELTVEKDGVQYRTNIFPAKDPSPQVPNPIDNREQFMKGLASQLSDNVQLTGPELKALTAKALRDQATIQVTLEQYVSSTGKKGTNWKFYAPVVSTDSAEEDDAFTE